MTNITPEIQYQVLNLFYESDSNPPQILIDQMLQYNEHLLDINGFFPTISNTQSKQSSSPQFVPLDGHEFGLDHEVFILAFHQTGTEQLLLDVADTKINEANLFLLNELLISTIKDIPLDRFYFRIKFNFDPTDEKVNVVVMSFAQLSLYFKLIIGLSNVSSPSDQIKETWKNTTIAKLRSELYQYALNHPDISKIWICIISTTLFIYYELESRHLELKHVETLKKITQPYITDPLIFAIEPITQGLDFIGAKNHTFFNQNALLYNKANWQFWLLNWFRIKKSTFMFEIQN